MPEIPATMRAVRLHAPGGIDALSVDSIEVTAPGKDEALVRVAFAGVNFIDVYKRTGLYPLPLPATLGEEGAGTVVAIGSGVTEVREGARVAWASVTGAYAEYALIPAGRLVQIPTRLSERDAAAVMLQGMTAHYLSTSTYHLSQGDTCLVQAAAGGVGLLLVQVAKKRGARVIGTVGTDEKATLARAVGADEVIVYTREDFVSEAKRLTGGRGVQVIYDSVGKSTFLPGLDALTPRGVMVLFGQSSGPVTPIDPMLLNRKGSLFLTRPTLAHYIATREELLSRADELFQWMLRGELSVRIDSEYPLDAVADAHAALEGRRTIGKILIRVSHDG